MQGFNLKMAKIIMEMNEVLEYDLKCLHIYFRIQQISQLIFPVIQYGMIFIPGRKCPELDPREATMSH